MLRHAEMLNEAQGTNLYPPQLFGFGRIFVNLTLFYLKWLTGKNEFNIRVYQGNDTIKTQQYINFRCSSNWANRYICICILSDDHYQFISRHFSAKSPVVLILCCLSWLSRVLWALVHAFGHISYALRSSQYWRSVVVCHNALLTFSCCSDQWYSTWGTRTPGGTRRHLRGYVK
jgi:hypothetical protein